MSVVLQRAIALLLWLVLVLVSTKAFADLRVVKSSYKKHLSTPSLDERNMRDKVCERGWGASSVPRIIAANSVDTCSNFRQVNWFKRDNSMAEIDVSTETTDDPIDVKVARSMARVMSRRGKSEAIQVCPGVYLMKAHGALDSPENMAIDNQRNAESEWRTKLRRPSEQRVYTISYPISKDNLMKTSTDEQFSSPVLDDPTKWGDPRYDFAFITVDSPNRPEDFVVPVTATISEATEISKTGNVHLYRSKTLFNLTADGVPDENQLNWVGSFKTMTETHFGPVRVNTPCRIGKGGRSMRPLLIGESIRYPEGKKESAEFDEMISTDCPIEVTVSGAPLITYFEDQPYLIGIANSQTRHEEKKVQHFSFPEGNHFVQSQMFCGYYENACPGYSCVDAKRIMNGVNKRTSE